MLALLLGCQTPESTEKPASTVPPTETTASTAPRSLEVSVRVTLDGAPASGVTILQGGNPARWTADPDGEATITVDLGVVGDLFVMASSPDARIAGEFVYGDDSSSSTGIPPVIEIALERFNPADNSAYVYASPGEGDPITSSSAECLHCHISTHAEWWASPHRTSASNPTLHDLYQGTAQFDAAACADHGGTWAPGVQPGYGTTTDLCFTSASVAATTGGSGGCADCHAPGIDGVAGGRDLLDATGVAYQYGVHCDVCHHVESVDVTKPPGVAGALHIVRPSEVSPSPVFGEWAPLSFGPFDDVPNPRMGAVHRPVFHEAVFCAGCHESEQASGVDPVRWPDGSLPIHSTYSEWLAGPMNPGAPCQSCHMPPDPTMASAAGLYADDHEGELIGIATGWERPPGSIRKHAWYGPRQPESGMLALAATIAVRPTVEADGVLAEVTVKNVGPGHAIPTGEPLRALLMTVTATCAGAALAPIEGDVLPAWAGALDEQTGGTTWPGAAVGDVLRVVRQGEGYVDYAGYGPFGDGRFDAAAKGIPVESYVGEAEVIAVDGDAVTLSAPLPAGDRVYRVRGQAEAGAPGWAFARVTVDAAGTPMVPHFLAVDVRSDNRLLPQSSWTSRHRFAPCEAPLVTATLRHRNYPWALATERGWAVTDVLMATATATP